MFSAEFKKKERATSEQLEEFLEFCKSYPEILQRKDRNSERMENLWLILCVKLNGMKGPTRSVKQWKQTLYHWKDQVISRVRRAKLAELNSAQTNLHLEPTNFDLKAIRVFGFNIDEFMTSGRSSQIEDQSNSSFLENASELHEMEVPLRDLMPNEVNIEDVLNGGKRKRRYKALSDDLDFSTTKKSITEQIVLKLNDMDAKLAALNKNLSKIANAIEKIANDF